MHFPPTDEVAEDVDDYACERPRYIVRTSFAHGTNILQISTGIYILNIYVYILYLYIMINICINKYDIYYIIYYIINIYLLYIIILYYY